MEGASPSAKLAPPLHALRHGLRGGWLAAHAIAQDLADVDATQVHADLIMLIPVRMPCLGSAGLWPAPLEVVLPEAWLCAKWRTRDDEEREMTRKRHTAEAIVSKRRQVDVLTSQGRPVAEAVRAIGVTEVTYDRWRSEYGGLKGDQVKRLKELEAEDTRLRRAVSDLTLEKLILQEAAAGNF